ncbi:type II 3-dehydroquinate dehydratase [Oscillospiraceae bacterium MB08-C2-2]|nr:type II 3-dehydroquinate dehydratase [Oscillospiraceae bacterium MB08-C2-2]
MKKILVIHGPNINLTGLRERGVYGSETLESIDKEIVGWANELGLACVTAQSNHEGEIIDWLHDAMEENDGVVINAGAYTHYSYAIRDAIAAITIPCVEVHFSNIQAREEFRHHSVIAPVCAGSIAGFGKNSYYLALAALSRMLEGK